MCIDHAKTKGFWLHNNLNQCYDSDTLMNNFFIWTHGEDETKHFIGEFNNFTTTFKFTFEFCKKVSNSWILMSTWKAIDQLLICTQSLQTLTSIYIILPAIYYILRNPFFRHYPFYIADKRNFPRRERHQAA